MKYKVCVLKVFIATLIVLCLFSSANAQVPELPDPGLPDIAMVKWHRGPIPELGIPYYNGPIILYNPIVASQIGPFLNAFFRTHEYCHIRLNHIQQQFYLSNPYNRSWMSQIHEFQADACATQILLSQGNINAVRAAAQWFYGQGPTQIVPSHPPGQARAVNIVSTASSLGVRLF